METVNVDHIKAVAMAIEGPYFAKHIEHERLETLRQFRWNALSDQEKGVRLMQARAALCQIHSKSNTARGLP